MNFFNFDIRKLMIVLFIAALPLLSINMQRNPGEDPWYIKPVSSAASLIQTSYASFTGGVRGTTSMYMKLIGIKRQNQELYKENAELRAKLAALTELKIKYDHLAKQLDFKQNSSMELLAAKVIGRDISPDRYSIRINRGYAHGLKRMQGVITVEGVVGYIYKIDRSSSQVLILTDRLASLDAIVQRTRARGLVSGKNSSSCRLRYLERADDVSPGDTIVTSGLQGYFPKGFPIGRITNVHKTGYGISQEADVVPIVNPNNLEEVFVILRSGEEDYTDKMNGGDDFGPPLLSKQNPEPPPAAPAVAPAAPAAPQAAPTPSAASAPASAPASSGASR